MKYLLVVIVLLFGSKVDAQLKKSIGRSDFSDWLGIEKVKKEVAIIKSGELISYQYSKAKSYSKGFRDYYANALDWSVYKGLTFDIYQKKESEIEIEILFFVDESNTRTMQGVSKAKIQLIGKGWQEVFVPWELFDLVKGQRGTLQGVTKLHIVANSQNNKTLQIKNIFLSKGQTLVLESKMKGKSAKAGNKVQYELELGNTTDENQIIQLIIPKLGWESMQTSIKPSVIELAPNEIKKCIVEVRIPSAVPQGVREKQVIKALKNGSEIASIEFTTVVTVPSPFIVHTNEGWDEVKEKTKNYDWAKDELVEYEAKAKKWNVPNYATTTAPINAFRGRYLFHNREADNAMNCAIAYRLTGKKEYAQKCVEMLRKLSDLENGYPATFRVNQNNFVKEGGVFQDLARTYDMVMDCGLFTDEDHILIENTFRLFIETVQLGNDEGGIGNWDLSELVGAFYCALTIQDFHLAEGVLNSPSGIIQQFAQGVMNDGWWYECSVGYNLWCSTMFSEVAIALRPWGINLVDKQIKLGTTPYYSLLPERMKPGLYGMDFNKWGALHKSSIGIKDMWNALIPFLDYRGVMFAVNDAKEDLVIGEPYELAYYLYRDPEYAAVIQRGTKRNLLYGVPELPNVISKKTTQSAYADNMGIVQLRSQTKGREQREQIQAALHYGTHGGYHGHFDRTNFLSMMRYGRSFYNPEMYWYGYKSFLYKFLVQTSINKNMVVVDEKMQEPKESFKTLFYTGDMMQVTAVETKARWSNPPYGGMVYGDKTGVPLTQKIWDEGRSIFVPKDTPEYGELTDFSEPVMQRRLMVMMDDYIVLADYLQANEEHTFDWLFQMKGFKEINADKLELIRHDNQMNTEPLGSAQFITDCNWYKTEGTSRSQFEMCWGEGCDNEGGRMPHSEDGVLKIDVITAWPQQNEIMIGTAPENFGVNKQLWYSVSADNETLLNDHSGVWILGSKNVELDITGKTQLLLSTKIKVKAKKNTVFWGDAKIILKDGSEVLVSSLPIIYKNINIPKISGLDYYGGPVKIAGEAMPNSTPGMPKNYKESGEIIIDLTGLDAVTFQAKIGGDFPLGDESSRRKTMAVRTKGKTTRYLSVIEPFESESVIKSVIANSANELVVELKDGRKQVITISELDGDGNEIKVVVKEYLKGILIREEQSFNNVSN
ncbi:hypothetical protein [Flavicella sp.]|uniref:COG1470 family protein n=1 Tax=Flavicella sp. TaxID=2957742 RepID=UPI003018FB4E